MICHKVRDNGIFHLNITDIINYNSVIEFFNEFVTLESVPENFKVLCDFRQSQIKLSKDEINNISKKAEAITAKFKTVHTAILVDQPDCTAQAILFTLNSIKSKSIRKVFSTEEMAYKWLGIKLD